MVACKLFIVSLNTDLHTHIRYIRRDRYINTYKYTYLHTYIIYTYTHNTYTHTHITYNTYIHTYTPLAVQRHELAVNQ